MTTVSSTSHARQQCPNRWRMRGRRVKCMVWLIVKTGFAEIFEKTRSYEGCSVDEDSALNIYAHWVQSLSIPSPTSPAASSALPLASLCSHYLAPTRVNRRWHQLSENDAESHSPSSPFKSIAPPRTSVTQPCHPRVAMEATATLLDLISLTRRYSAKPSHQVCLSSSLRSPPALVFSFLGHSLPTCLAVPNTLLFAYNMGYEDDS